MNTSYRILATVTLQHDYYTDGRCNDFDIVPSAATAAALKGAGIRTKMVDNVFLLLVKVNETGKPFIGIPAGLKLIFYLQLGNTNFINFTNVPYQPIDRVFYFTNLYKTKVGGINYLNKQAGAFSNAVSYNIGDLVRDGANVYEALKPVSNGAHGVNDANWWYKRANNQYVNNNDTIVISDGRLEAKVLPAKAFDVSFFALNDDTQTYDVAVGNSIHQEFTEDVSLISIDAKSMQPGKYRVVINGQERYMLIDSVAAYKRVFGVIEMYNAFAAGSDAGWLDSGGKPKGMDFIIRFANRLTIWKYIVHNEQITGVEDTDVPNRFTAATAPLQFISINPIPMKQQAVKTIQLMKGAAVVTTKLPNPSPYFISTHTDGNNNTYYCSEMFLKQ